VLDVCTGSGSIAVAIAKLTGAVVTATDICTNALSLAKENAALHNVDIRFVQGDLLSGIAPQDFDIIVSNPPYIPTHELATLQPELSYEPKLALDGGLDGMNPYRRLVPEAFNFLTPGGVLLLEIGSPEVEGILQKAGYDMIRLINDYAGLPRILTGRRPLKLT